MSKKLNLIGQTFGRLTVIEQLPSENRRTFWLCQCECGNIIKVKGKYLSNGDTKSCGCLNLQRIQQMGLDNVNRNKYEIKDDIIYVYFNNTNNYFICDVKDLSYVKDTTWWETESGYARGTINGRFIFFHNYILNRNGDMGIVPDHINGNRLDNCRNNLRIVNKSQNCINRGLHKNNTSGAKGVSWDKVSKKWHSYISINRKNINLGLFDDINDAIEVRKNAELEYHKEYSRK